MPTDREALHRLLMECADDPRLVVDAMEAIAPLLDLADGRHGCGVPAEVLTECRVSRAIAQATGRDVRKVVFVDRLHPAYNKRRRQFTSREVPPDRLVREDHLDEDLGQVLQASLGDSVALYVGHDKLATAGSALLWHLWTDLRRGVYPESRVAAAAARNGLWLSLLYFTGFSLTDSRLWLRCLQPLIGILPWALPLGTSVEEPGTWYVLTASGR